MIIESGQVAVLSSWNEITLWPEDELPLGRSISVHPKLHNGDYVLIIDVPTQLQTGRAMVLTRKGIGWVSLWAINETLTT